MSSPLLDGLPTRDIFRTLEPFVVAPRENLPALDLCPFGLPISHRIDPLELRSETFLTLLQTLDARTFGPEGMPMPRWVFFDCAELPACIAGLGIPSERASRDMREVLEVPDEYSGLIPLSMYIALPMYGVGDWFGHNLASLAPVLAERSPSGPNLRGLGSVTKSFGLRVMRAQRLHGATQWASLALFIHTKFGPLSLETAYTPAHSEHETITYSFEVTEARLLYTMGGQEHREERPEPDFFVRSDDIAAMKALQSRIETGERFVIPSAPIRDGGVNRVPVTRIAP